MYNHGVLDDAFIRMRVDDLLREAENERLAQLAARHRRPWRARFAVWLVAVAEWVDGHPQGSIARAEA